MKLDDWLDEFLLYLEETGRKVNTIQCYKARLNPLVDYLRLKDPELISLADLEAFLSHYKGKWGKNTQNTLATYIQAAKTFFQFCTNRGHYQVSPARNLVRPSRAGDGMTVQPGDMVLCQLTPSDPARLASDDGSLPGRMEEFFDYLRAMGRRQATLEMYEEGLRSLTNYFIGVRICDITPRMMDNYVISLKDHYAAETINMKVRMTKTFFRFLVTRLYLTSSSAVHLHIPKQKGISSNKVIKQPDLESMLDYAKGNGLVREYAWLLFLADTGCRTGEMQSVNLTDLDLIKCEAVARGKVGERILDFTPETGQALAAWLKIRPATDREALFTTRNGRLSHAAIYHGLQAIAFQLGLTRFNPHSIRHRVGQAWTDRGASLELVRLKLGHKDVETTAKFYLHQDHDRMKKATNRFFILGSEQNVPAL